MCQMTNSVENVINIRLKCATVFTGIFARASIAQLQRCGTKGRDSPDEERNETKYPSGPVRRII